MAKRLTEAEAFKQLQQSPIKFIEVMWHLSPQPLKDEYKEQAIEAISGQRWKAFKKSWFEPFVKGEHMTWQQWVILLALESAVKGLAPKRISVRSGHGIGKDTTVSWIVLWFLFCYLDAQVPCTAPTSDQLSDILWKEIAKWHNRMPDNVKMKYDIKSEYVRIVERPNTWFARARTSKKETPEALAGVHGDHVLYIAEEASGIPQEVFDTAEGAMTSDDSFFIMISNPTRLEGAFHASHHQDKQMWQCLHFNGEDSPIVDWEYAERIANKHGKESDEYRIRVLGEFPQKDIEMDGWIPILSKDEIDQALQSDMVEHAGMNATGVDVADEGDNESVIVRRSMNLAEVLYASNRINNILLAGEVIVYTDDLNLQYENTAVDKIGVGSGTYHRLVEQKKSVHGVNVSISPKDPLSYVNLKAEGYWKLREWIKRGGKLKPSRDPDGKERWYQLLNVRYKTADSSGKIMIMPKDQMRRKGIASPDVAEALMLTFCIPVIPPHGITAADVHFARKMMLKKKNKR